MDSRTARICITQKPTNTEGTRAHRNFLYSKKRPPNFRVNSSVFARTQLHSNTLQRCQRKNKKVQTKFRYSRKINASLYGTLFVK